MDQINSVTLRQSVDIDARLVKSAIRPSSNEKLKELRKEYGLSLGLYPTPDLDFF